MNDYRMISNQVPHLQIATVTPSSLEPSPVPAALSTEHAAWLAESELSAETLDYFVSLYTLHTLVEKLTTNNCIATCRAFHAGAHQRHAQRRRRVCQSPMCIGSCCRSACGSIVTSCSISSCEFRVCVRSATSLLTPTATEWCFASINVAQPTIIGVWNRSFTANQRKRGNNICERSICISCLPRT